MTAFQFKQHSTLPGFGLTFGLTLSYLGLLVLLPLTLLFVCTVSMSWEDFRETVFSPQVVAAYKLSFRTALIAAAVNAVFGFIAAWTLVRYRFPGKRIVDSLIDIPFAMPTAISGIALTTLCSKKGWVGSFFTPFGMKISFTEAGIIVALIFIGLPFVVRTLQPALEDLDKEVEEASASLGATRFQTFCRVIFPAVFPAWATGFTLALARALGEYGSVVFISGNRPMQTEIAPLLIVSQIERFHTEAAAAIAVVMLSASFLLMLLINMIQWYARKRFH
ncbi:MAG: sulfate ABC transporter permease subunit CysT [Planctomycetaceae bacterium]|jgi:sulfate transport system permease protein|nr:sulfate ABC transporter permease subunit CysT [Planctomycetaceae bacterium]